MRISPHEPTTVTIRGTIETADWIETAAGEKIWPTKWTYELTYEEGKVVEVCRLGGEGRTRHNESWGETWLYPEHYEIEEVKDLRAMVMGTARIRLGKIVRKLREEVAAEMRKALAGWVEERT